MDPRLGHDDRAAEVARAARILWVRSRREASGWLAGGYASAFRGGGGVEFEELRPYAPGDDVRAIDWNATARSGTPWVKRFREERAHTVLLALDVSASMGFGTTGRSKLETAARAAAGLAAAAARAGDRVGFLAFADAVREALPPARGSAQLWRVVRAASRHARHPGGATDLAVAADWALARARRRAIVVLLSDFRTVDPEAPPPSLAALAGRHELVAARVEDPRERVLAAAGRVRLVDPESGRRLLLPTGRRQRERYVRAAAARRAALERRLRSDGADLLTLDTSGDPVRDLARFFRQRARARGGAR